MRSTGGRACCAVFELFTVSLRVPYGVPPPHPARRELERQLGGLRQQRAETEAALQRERAAGVGRQTAGELQEMITTLQVCAETGLRRWWLCCWSQGQTCIRGEYSTEHSKQRNSRLPCCLIQPSLPAAITTQYLTFSISPCSASWRRCGPPPRSTRGWPWNWRQASSKGCGGPARGLGVLQPSCISVACPCKSQCVCHSTHSLVLARSPAPLTLHLTNPPFHPCSQGGGGDAAAGG